jgi:hypothetical protein
MGNKEQKKESYEPSLLFRRKGLSKGRDEIHQDKDIRICMTPCDCIARLCRSQKYVNGGLLGSLKTDVSARKMKTEGLLLNIHYSQ